MDLVTNVVTGSNADRLLLLLHGYGADERDLGGLLGYLDPDGRFATVLPRGRVAAPPGFSWFDMASEEPDDIADAFAEALAAVDDLLDAACAEHGFARAAGGRRRVLPGRRARARARRSVRPSAPGPRACWR